jgi:hypothetical protein
MLNTLLLESQPSEASAASWCLGGGVKVHPSPLYKEGVPGGEMHNTSHEPSSMASSYHLLVCRPCLGHRHLPLSLPRGLPKGCAGDANHYRDSIVLRSFWIPLQSRLLPHLGWKRGFESHHGHRTCASMERCRSCGAGVVAPRSSRP